MADSSDGFLHRVLWHRAPDMVGRDVLLHAHSGPRRLSGTRLRMEIVSFTLSLLQCATITNTIVRFQLPKNVYAIVLSHRSRTSKVQYTRLSPTARAVRLSVYPRFFLLSLLTLSLP